MRRDARRAGVLVLVGVVCALIGAPSALAAPTPGPEKRPRAAACSQNSEEIKKAKLDTAKLSEPPWGQQRLALAEAYRLSTGRGVTVAVVDSGVDATHPQLKGRVLPGWDATSGKLAKGGADVDCLGHGTLVAGIIAAAPVPDFPMSGVAPDATILPIRQSWGTDDNAHPIEGSPANLLLALRQAIGSGARVVNVSVTVPAGQLSPAQRGQFEAVAALAASKDVLLVVASGNDQPDRDENRESYPAKLAETSPNVMAVAGIQADGTADPQAVSGAFVRVAAPGKDVVSTMVGGGHVVWSGTSYATPFVSGVAALVRSRYPTLTAAQTRTLIETTADHPSTDLPNPQVGYGVVNPVAALTTVLLPPTVAEPAPVGTPMPAGSAARGPGRLAVAVAGSALGISALAVTLATVVRRGRRRGWRPGPGPQRLTARAD